MCATDESTLQTVISDTEKASGMLATCTHLVSHVFIPLGCLFELLLQLFNPFHLLCKFHLVLILYGHNCHLNHQKNQVACTTQNSLTPRPHPLTRKRAWWLLSAFLVVLSQQSWFSNKWGSNLYDVALFHWLVSTFVWHAISLACSEPILVTQHNQESAQ